MLFTNRCNGLQYVFKRGDESPLGRSMRKLRRKVRFNIAAGIFKPSGFWTLTFDECSYEYLKMGCSVSVIVSEFFAHLRKRGHNVSNYCWRVEMGTQGTKRAHVHMLYEGYVPLELVVQCWSLGFVNMKGFPDAGDDREEIISNYLSKYLSKTELEDDAIVLTGRRFGTSRGLVPVPKNQTWRCEDLADNRCLEQTQVAMEHNISVAQNSVKEFVNNPLLGYPPLAALCEWLDSPYSRSKMEFSWRNARYWGLNSFAEYLQELSYAKQYRLFLRGGGSLVGHYVYKTLFADLQKV